MLTQLPRAVLLSIIFGVGFGCKREEKFPSLEDRLASPIDVAADSTGQFFFVLNSDYPRDYNAGSIITLNKDGERVGVVGTKRLGRSLTVAGNDMIATYSGEGEDGPPLVELYDITSPATPKRVAFWQPEACNPINAVMSPGYKYFAVACANGVLQIGELASDRTQSLLHFVRRYPEARRAMHIDTKRNLLFAFPTDLGALGEPDKLLADEKTVADDLSNKTTPTPNEIPDAFEATPNDRRNKGRRGKYQYAVFDIDAAAKNVNADNVPSPFPLIEDIAILQPELRWTYFNLSNFDGTPDVPFTTDSLKNRYYRTNFWNARPDPADKDVFYLSHRGSSDSNRAGSLHANSIIKVRILGDLKPAGLAPPKTEDVLAFERVYGFKDEGAQQATRHFPGDFELELVNGSPLLVVNHFRDPIYFPSSQYSALASKVVGDNTWFSEIVESDTGHGYYQIALTATGRAMAVSFYQNILILLDTTPGAAITEVKTIN